VKQTCGARRPQAVLQIFEWPRRVGYRVLTAPSIQTNITRFTSLGYLLLILAFSSFTYFPPKLYLFEQHHHYVPIGQYGIDADPQVGDHPWDE